jgi:hypothetical protein
MNTYFHTLAGAAGACGAMALVRAAVRTMNDPHLNSSSHQTTVFPTTRLRLPRAPARIRPAPTRVCAAVPGWADGCSPGGRARPVGPWIRWLDSGRTTRAAPSVPTAVSSRADMMSGSAGRSVRRKGLGHECSAGQSVCKCSQWSLKLIAAAAGCVALLTPCPHICAASAEQLAVKSQDKCASG